MKLEERDWNSSKSRPKNPEATFNGYIITNEMVRYESALNRALAIQPEVSKSNLKDFKKLFQSILSPANGEEEKEHDFLSYFNAYLQKIKERKQSNEKFRHFKKKMESADSIFLSEEKLDKMYRLKLTGHLDKVRNYFLIGASTGLHFEDWDRVSSEKVVNGVLTLRSSKTGEVSTIPLHPVVNAELDKYNGELPHKPSNQKMNEYIKVVAMRANINVHVESRITKGGVRKINTSD